MGFWADRKARKERERAERAEHATRTYLAGTGNVNPYGLVDPNLAILTVLAQQENTPEPLKDEDMDTSDTTPYDAEPRPWADDSSSSSDYSSSGSDSGSDYSSSSDSGSSYDGGSSGGSDF